MAQESRRCSRNGRLQFKAAGREALADNRFPRAASRVSAKHGSMPARTPDGSRPYPLGPGQRPSLLQLKARRTPHGDHRASLIETGLRAQRPCCESPILPIGLFSLWHPIAPSYLKTDCTYEIHRRSYHRSPRRQGRRWHRRLRRRSTFPGGPSGGDGGRGGSVCDRRSQRQYAGGPLRPHSSGQERERVSSDCYGAAGRTSP